MGSLGYVHGIPAYAMVQIGRDGHCGLPMAWDPWDMSMGSQHTPWYRWVGMVGHSGLPMAWDPWDTSMRSQHTPWYRWVGMDTVDYQWHGIPRIRPWDPSIHLGTEG